MRPFLRQDKQVSNPGKHGTNGNAKPKSKSPMPNRTRKPRPVMAACILVLGETCKAAEAVAVRAEAEGVADAYHAAKPINSQGTGSIEEP